jgi:hypothetical protein
MMLSGGSLRKMYLSEANGAITDGRNTGECYSESDFASLTEPVRKYFIECGYLGKEKYVDKAIKKCLPLLMQKGRRWMMCVRMPVNSAIFRR